MPDGRVLTCQGRSCRLFGHTAPTLLQTRVRQIRNCSVCVYSYTLAQALLRFVLSFVSSGVVTGAFVLWRQYGSFGVRRDGCSRFCATVRARDMYRRRRSGMFMCTLMRVAKHG